MMNTATTVGQYSELPVKLHGKSSN